MACFLYSDSPRLPLPGARLRRHYDESYGGLRMHDVEHAGLSLIEKLSSQRAPCRIGDAYLIRTCIAPGLHSPACKVIMVMQ